MKALWLQIRSTTSDVFLVFAMIGILLVLFTPISPGTLDFLLILNFSTALLILLVTFYTEKPLEFSTLPSLLLMTTLFRLALNISSTRLILDEAHAGKVIDAVGTQVVGGSYVIGLVVFLILIVVQYVVVTNGAQRVAEVAARFILDSLPGKQMSIDADLNMGIIDQGEAKKRRSELEKESNFYGAMDGASKFVKGDAIAGIIIVIINIVGGLTIGIVQKGMSWGEALQRYTLLTVGDGIVTQIPSLIIAVATGIIITRAATDTRLGAEITRQFTAHPKTIVIVVLTLLALMVVPGIPALPILFIVLGFSALAWFSYKKLRTEKAEKDALDQEENQIASSETEALYSSIKTNPFELTLGKDLAGCYLTADNNLENRIGILRKQIAQQLGFVIPPATAKTDLKLENKQYRVSIRGIQRGSGSIEPEHLLAINPGGERAKLEGVETIEPTYGLPAQWISPKLRSRAHAAGYTLVDAETVLVTHIQELCRKNAAEFITRTETEKLIENSKASLNTLVEELIPAILSYSDVQNVLQSLVSENVPINNLELILEVLVDFGRQTKDPDLLAEKVRERIGAMICSQLNDEQGRLQVLTLSPDLERRLLSTSGEGKKHQIMLPPQEMEGLITQVAKACERMLVNNVNPVLLCASPIRKALRNLLVRTIPQLNILATSEIRQHDNIISAGVIALGGAEHRKLESG